MKEEEADDNRSCPSYTKAEEAVFVEAGVPAGKMRSESGAALTSSWDSLSPEQQVTEDGTIK